MLMILILFIVSKKLYRLTVKDSFIRYVRSRLNSVIDWCHHNLTKILCYRTLN